MATVNEKMIALADEIRILSGTTDLMGLDAMKTNVADANIELNTQSNLISEQDAKIAELAQVLAGKAGGGGMSFPYKVTVNANLSVASSIFYNNDSMEVIVVISSPVGHVTYSVIGGEISKAGVWYDTYYYWHITSISSDITLNITYS